MTRLLLGLAIVTLAGGAPPLAMALTPDQVSAGFREGAIRYCLEAVLQGVPLSQTPEESRKGIAPAEESMRDLVRASNPDGPIWDVLTAKGIVVISEPKSGGCEVFAYGPPVERTFKAVLKDARKRAPGFTQAPVRPGYDPIVYRLEQSDGSGKITIDLRGAEPGAPGHMFRFSTVTATINRAP